MTGVSFESESSGSLDLDSVGSGWTSAELAMPIKAFCVASIRMRSTSESSLGSTSESEPALLDAVATESAVESTVDGV